MSHIPPIQPVGSANGASLPETRPASNSTVVPAQAQKVLFFQAEALQKVPGEEVVKATNLLKSKAFPMAEDVALLEHSLAIAEYAQKTDETANAMTSLGSANVDFAQERFIEPINLFKKVGVDVGEKFDTIATNYMNAELALACTEGLVTGTSLIVRRQFLEDAKQFLEILQERRKQLKEGSQEVIQLDAYIQTIREKIIKEKVILAEDAKNFGISQSLYLPRAISNAWEIVGKAVPAASLALGWATGVTIAIRMGYQVRKLKETVHLHKKWRTEVEELAEKHKTPSNAVLDERSKLKKELRDLTFKKHDAIDDYLQFNLVHKEVGFFATTFLFTAYLVVQTTAVVIAVASLALVPQFALLGLAVAGIALGLWYWGSNRPNMFKALVSTYLQSTYYSIGNAIDSWKLQRKKLHLMELTAEHVGLVAKYKFSLTPMSASDKDKLEKFSSIHNTIRANITVLEKDVKYWHTKQNEIKSRLLDAELADLNREHGKKSLDVKGMVDAIKKQFKNFTKADKEELRDVVGLNLEKLGNNPSEEDIRNSLLNSYLGMGEDKMLAQLKEEKMFKKRKAAA